MARSMRKRWSVVNLETGEQTYEWYMSAENVIGYGLTKPKYDAGQYDIYPCDDDGIRTDEPVRAYKRV